MNILLVDDNEGSNFLMQKAFEGASVDCRVSRVEDGAAALVFINRQEPFQCD